MLFLVLTVLLTPLAVVAAPADSSSIESIKEELQTNMNIVWTCIAAFLVFFMQIGFVMVKAAYVATYPGGARSSQTAKLQYRSFCD